MFVAVALVASTAVAGAARGPHPRQGSLGPGNPREDTSAPTFPANVSVANVRSWVERAVAYRLSVLAGEQAALSSNSRLTTQDRSALEGIVAADANGLRSLRSGLSADKNVASLQRAADSVVLDYRVVNVVVLQVTAVIALDRAIESAASLATTAPSVEAAITTESGIADTSNAQSEYLVFASDVAAIQNSLATSDAAVLALNPASYVAAPSTFASASRAATSAGSALKTAESELRAIVKDLRSANARPTTTLPNARGVPTTLPILKRVPPLPKLSV